MNKLFGYELKNLIGNWYVLGWGILFPVFSLEVFPRIFMDQIPEAYRSQALTSTFLGFALIIPLAIVLIGFSISLAQELEHNIPERIRLFGFSNGAILRAKMLAQFIYLIAALAIFTAIAYLSYPLQTPTLRGAAITLFSVLIFSAILFILAYAIAYLIRKMNLVNAIILPIYMIVLFVSGLFGFPVEKLPPFIQRISKLLPTYYLGNEYYDVWVSKPYNFAPFIQSMLLLAAISGLLLFWSMYRDRRKLV